jgi:GNAT superfamily N-acetyltransferase
MVLTDALPSHPHAVGSPPAAMRDGPLTVELRPSRDTDREFLVALYASTRSDEWAATGWPADERDAFVRMQFDLQDRHYRSAFPNAQHSLIVVDGRPIGRVIVDRGTTEIRIVDISLMPEHRGHGIGSALLRRVLAEATIARIPVGLSVHATNPARHLYERLGFAVTDASNLYVSLEWRP